MLLNWNINLRSPITWCLRLLNSNTLTHYTASLGASMFRSYLSSLEAQFKSLREVWPHVTLVDTSECTMGYLMPVDLFWIGAILPFLGLGFSVPKLCGVFVALSLSNRNWFSNKFSSYSFPFSFSILLAWLILRTMHWIFDSISVVADHVSRKPSGMGEESTSRSRRSRDDTHEYPISPFPDYNRYSRFLPTFLSRTDICTTFEHIRRSEPDSSQFMGKSFLHANPRCFDQRNTTSRTTACCNEEECRTGVLHRWEEDWNGWLCGISI